MKNLKYYIPSPIRDFFYGIYNIIRWSKVIYKDRDWDEASAISCLSAQCPIDENMAFISAKKGWGLNRLLELIQQNLKERNQLG